MVALAGDPEYVLLQLPRPGRCEVRRFLDYVE